MSVRKYLSLDLGEARIGLAFADGETGLVFGRGYLKRSNLKADIAALRKLSEKEKIDILVLGLPLRTDGDDSKQTQRVRAFARSLEKAGFRVEFQDERFSSIIAQDGLAKSGLSRRKRREKGLLDERAAIVILENYLAGLREGAYEHRR